MRKIFSMLGAALLIAAASSSADAQERKKSSERERAQQERTSRQNYSGNSCIGGMFLIRDGESVTCSLPDGRTCTVTAGTSGQAIISNCK